MTKRVLTLLLALAVVLLLATVWGYRYMEEQRLAAAKAESDLADCRIAAGDIRQCRDKPAQAAERERGPGEMNALIEKAAQASGITVADSLDRITPQSPRPVPDTVYREQPTGVVLRKVTLRQLVPFLHSLLTSGTGLRAKSIHLSAPREEELGDRWTADLLLSYLIYDPSQAQR
jgi:hypothetical protein